MTIQGCQERLDEACKAPMPEGGYLRLEDVIEAYGFSSYLRDGDLHLDRYIGYRHLVFPEHLLKLLAPFVKDYGFIGCVGEGVDQWEYTFSHGRIERRDYAPIEQ